MFIRLLAVSTLALAMATSAFAQSSQGSQTEGGPGNDAAKPASPGGPDLWSGQVGQIFFSDSSGKLRSQEEIRTGWANLTADQQAQLRADCKNLASSAGASQNNADVTGSVETTASPAAKMEACKMVDGM
ncbi:hypothetical protein [Rhizobium sp. BK251]|uniref:hypothetical protein n=1 Tax=Rhizobium sp. BK251 TaxID=2512125 RepID=UPI0010442F13|nr:hypothetical protein [Rhizobium sp. BK251]TCL63623.1 hypothetical protein EV286_11618 [Rhizobium sp. BK251]